MKRPILIALIGYIIGIIWELYLGISIAPVLISILVFLLLLNFNKRTSDVRHYS